ncbi:MAG: RHS repeat-associated core domain-containing protein [Deltaproteobacteria bacterium]|nr:RHS repeat-associated core domain-containing protein [Deltaproteobacteria bacterium]
MGSRRKFLSFSLILVIVPLAASAGQTIYYHPDLLGSSSAISDRSGELLQHEEYTPYGEPIVSKVRAGSITASYLYTNQELDRGSDLYYFGARSYDPATARFLSRDPVQEGLPYSYANSNPVIYVDPDGNTPALFWMVVMSGLTFVGFDSMMVVLANDPKGILYAGKPHSYTPEDMLKSFRMGFLLGLGNPTSWGVSSEMAGTVGYLYAVEIFAAADVGEGVPVNRALQENALFPIRAMESTPLIGAALIDYMGRHYLGNLLTALGFKSYDQPSPSIDQLIIADHLASWRNPFFSSLGSPARRRLWGRFQALGRDKEFLLELFEGLSEFLDENSVIENYDAGFSVTAEELDALRSWEEVSRGLFRIRGEMEQVVIPLTRQERRGTIWQVSE